MPLELRLAGYLLRMRGSHDSANCTRRKNHMSRLVNSLFFCLGCNEPHGVNTNDGGWEWNGSEESPTLSPSILVRADYTESRREDRICHSFITNGEIKYLSDCTHHLAGQTIPLPDYEESCKSYFQRLNEDAASDAGQS
jgi:hypothetical protein